MKRQTIDIIRRNEQTDEISHDQARSAFYIFQTLCDYVEENRRELRDRFEDSRFVWLPLQYGLKPEEH